MTAGAGYDAIAQTKELHVALAVQAATSFAVWGQVRYCVPSNETADRSPISFPSGTWERKKFTACDSDNLPVSHQLPTRADSREFTAEIGRTGDPPSVLKRIEYVGDGIYEAYVSRNGENPWH
eukprot:6530531-Prymnesium_polylepis.1